MGCSGMDRRRKHYQLLYPSQYLHIYFIVTRYNIYITQDILYHINWLKGAKTVYGLDIDYIGVWNERMWNDAWIIEFRNALNEAGFANTQIVAPDRDWGIANDMLANATLMNAVSLLVILAIYVFDIER